MWRWCTQDWSSMSSEYYQLPHWDFHSSHHFGADLGWVCRCNQWRPRRRITVGRRQGPLSAGNATSRSSIILAYKHWEFLKMRQLQLLVWILPLLSTLAIAVGLTVFAPLAPSPRPFLLSLFLGVFVVLLRCVFFCATRGSHQASRVTCIRHHVCPAVQSGDWWSSLLRTDPWTSFYEW